MPLGLSVCSIPYTTDRPPPPLLLFLPLKCCNKPTTAARKHVYEKKEIPLQTKEGGRGGEACAAHARL